MLLNSVFFFSARLKFPIVNILNLTDPGRVAVSVFSLDGRCTKIYISLYWNVPYVFGKTCVYARLCVYRELCLQLLLAISNEIAGGREATLILIQIVLARAIRHCHMSQGRRRRATLVVITSPSASELTRSPSVIWRNSEAGV